MFGLSSLPLNARAAAGPCTYIYNVVCRAFGHTFLELPFFFISRRPKSHDHPNDKDATCPTQRRAPHVFALLVTSFVRETAPYRNLPTPRDSDRAALLFNEMTLASVGGAMPNLLSLFALYKTVCAMVDKLNYVWTAQERPPWSSSVLAVTLSPTSLQ